MIQSQKLQTVSQIVKSPALPITPVSMSPLELLALGDSSLQHNVGQRASHASEQQGAKQQQASHLPAAIPHQLADHLAELKQEFKDICRSVFDDELNTNALCEGQTLLSPQVTAQTFQSCTTPAQLCQWQVCRQIRFS